MGKRGKKGRFFEYRDERNSDLLRVFRECVMSSPEEESMEVVYQRIVESKSKRFWVSEEQASKVISYMMKGNNIDYMGNNKKRMFEEIYSRVMKLRIENPDMRIFRLVEIVVAQEAPCFYMTPGSAKVIISQIKSKWCQQRSQLLRFLR
ncbi:hypothetical protein NXX39_20920 [Bacteroides ovatus]|jgi:hypothetical protein|uniref:hypothetical protein n=1 Tax=Bacteroides ovatus TaxID=28116 RepID=UPI001CCB9817|nr:hypothetical protein [Bacteroides ovatus]MCS2475542.1 hypothetical protein [Bacteroides ovatus]MCS3099787.1 hypothetical protein [Bacteroides ovatus]UBF06639.1 hypothetical protein K6V23_19650 [Bacteroides ovatus]DAO62608.1 MAG TPA: hypothetical protein [Caudoviricetes sp.]